MSYMAIFMELGKVRLITVVLFTMITGFVLATGEVNRLLILPMIGFFLLAYGAAALNEYQERFIDAKMPRTATRPIPSGAISTSLALVVITLTTMSGVFILWFTGGLVAAGLGVLALLWYNGIYTYLKRTTPLAVIPGSVIGAIPPAIGWVVAGGNPLDPRILAVSTFFFIWQIPHFWLLLLIFGKQYEVAGFPSLTQRFTEIQLSRLTFMWIIMSVLMSAAIPLFGATVLPLSSILIAIFAVWMIVSSINLLKTAQLKSFFRSSFIRINVYIVLIMVVLAADSILTFVKPLPVALNTPISTEGGK